MQPYEQYAASNVPGYTSMLALAREETTRRHHHVPRVGSFFEAKVKAVPWLDKSSGRPGTGAVLL